MDIVLTSETGSHQDVVLSGAHWCSTNVLKTGQTDQMTEVSQHWRTKSQVEHDTVKLRATWEVGTERCSRSSSLYSSQLQALVPSKNIKWQQTHQLRVSTRVSLHGGRCQVNDSKTPLLKLSAGPLSCLHSNTEYMRRRLGEGKPKY